MRDTCPSPLFDATTLSNELQLLIVVPKCLLQVMTISYCATNLRKLQVLLSR